MLRETGKIVAIESNVLWVETIQHSTCGNCVAQKGCGHTLINKVGAKPVYIRVLLEGRRPENYHINDRIEIGIPDDVVVKGSLLAYLLPVALALVFSSISHNIWSLESRTIIAAVFGFITGSLVVAWHSSKRRGDNRYQPVIIDDQTPLDLHLF